MIPAYAVARRLRRWFTGERHTKMKKDDCIFCKLANGDIPTRMIYEDDNFAVFMDMSPAAKGHSLVVPKEHYANIYEIDDDGLSVLNLNSSEYSILHWIAILLENRTFDVTTALAREAKDYLLEAFPVPYKEYDVIIGYRADDSYFAFAQDFINGAISVRQLGNAMRLW